jgi:hypothetical protein
MGTPRQVVSSAAALILALAPKFAAAQVVPPATGTAHVIEWDLTGLPDQIDGNPGAMVVDTRGEDGNRLWFITRIGDPLAPGTSPQRIYRFDPAASLYRTQANWSSWELRADLIAGGIKKIRPSHDRRFVFARTTSFIQRIDTQNCSYGSARTCERTVYSYPDEEPQSPLVFVSDIAVDDGNKVFTAGVSPTAPFDAGYVQLLNTSQTATPNTSLGNRLTINAKRWPVAGGAGACVANGIYNLTCNAGIDIHPSKQYLVYYTETGNNTIAELNTSITNPSYAHPNIRRWSLDTLGVKANDASIKDPRSLKIDRWGRVWINTGSGHLVSLDPSTSRMTKHQLPDGASNDLFGVAPDDDVIGYTASNTNKVGMLFPKFAALYVPPTTDAVAPVDFPVLVTKEASARSDGTAPATAKIVAAKTSACDGTCVEALIDTAIYSSNPSAGPSLSPLGITPNKSKAQGTFFYTVGIAETLLDPNDPASLSPSIARRIGFVRLPNKEKIKNGRDDDDSDDGYDRTRQPSWHNSEVGDEDADGVPDQYDMSTSRDTMTRGDAAPLAGQQTVDYPISSSTGTLALIAAVEADPTAQIAVDIYNALGTLTATSGPMVGAAVCTLPLPSAGAYTARVRNLGVGPVTQTPTFIVRDAMPQQ